MEGKREGKTGGREGKEGDIFPSCFTALMNLPSEAHTNESTKDNNNTNQNANELFLNEKCKLFFYF